MRILKTEEEKKESHKISQKKYLNSLTKEQKINNNLKKKLWRDNMKITNPEKTKEDRIKGNILYKKWNIKQKELGNDRKDTYYPEYYIKNKNKLIQYNNDNYYYKKEVKKLYNILI